LENLSVNEYFANESSTFGDRIIAAREAVGLSQSELARKLGVQLKTVKKWEEDLSEPRANKLQMIAGLLNVSITWLIMGHGTGLEGPLAVNDLSADMNEILIELRHTKSEFSRLTQQLDSLEKRLRRIGVQ
jgi:transcriptional regulator with XRE-family HTH domain